MDIMSGEKRKPLHLSISTYRIIIAIWTALLRLNILNTASVAFPVLSRSLAPKSPRSRKSSDASPRDASRGKIRALHTADACMHRAGRRDASWTMGVAFTSATPACRPSLARRNERNTRDASTMSPGFFSRFPHLWRSAIYRRDAMSSVTLAFFVTFGMYQSEEERPAVGRSGNVVSPKWAARQFLAKCIPQVYRKNRKTAAGLKCARESAVHIPGSTMGQFCNIL